MTQHGEDVLRFLLTGPEYSFLSATVRCLNPSPSLQTSSTTAAWEKNSSCWVFGVQLLLVLRELSLSELKPSNKFSKKVGFSTSKTESSFDSIYLYSAYKRLIFLVTFHVFLFCLITVKNQKKSKHFNTCFVISLLKVFCVTVFFCRNWGGNDKFFLPVLQRKYEKDLSNTQRSENFFNLFREKSRSEVSEFRVPNSGCLNDATVKGFQGNLLKKKDRNCSPNRFALEGLSMEPAVGEEENHQVIL